jgi:hypothetical protein
MSEPTVYEALCQIPRETLCEAYMRIVGRWPNEAQEQIAADLAVRLDAPAAKQILHAYMVEAGLVEVEAEGEGEEDEGEEDETSGSFDPKVPAPTPKSTRSKSTRSSSKSKSKPAVTP